MKQDHQVEQDDLADRWYLGVDGGGSKTLAIIVDQQGRERGSGLAGSANYATIGLAEAVQNICSAVMQAKKAAGIEVLSKAWLGLAGVDRPTDAAYLHPYLSSLAMHVKITNDSELILSACPNAVGIALIAGTGSIAIGQDGYGKVVRTGGWGYLIGDEGSGYTLATRALQMAVQAVDGRGQSTLLLPAILQHWQLARADDLLDVVYNQHEKGRIARLSRCVLEVASQGDEVAQQMVEQGALDLAAHVYAVYRQLDLSGQPLTLALSGGLLLHEAEYREQVLNATRLHVALEQVILVDCPALSAARAAGVV